MNAELWQHDDQKELTCFKLVTCLESTIANKQALMEM